MSDQRSRQTGDNGYVCDHCKKRFSSKSNLIRHMNIHTDTGAQNVANAVPVAVSWQYTGKVIQERNRLNVLFVANDLHS